MRVGREYANHKPSSSPLSHAIDTPCYYIYIPLRQRISRPTYDTDPYLPFPRFPFPHIIPLLPLYSLKALPYPNRLESCFCLGPIRKRVLCPALNRTVHFQSRGDSSVNTCTADPERPDMRRPSVQEKHSLSPLPSPSPGLYSLRTTSILKLFRDILSKLGSSRGFFHRFFRHWALFLTFLGRRLGIWRLWDDRKRGAFPTAKQAERSYPSTESSSDSKEHAIVGASSIPESASRPSLRDMRASTVGAGMRSNRSSADLSSYSRASDRLSIIQTRSRESLNAPIGQTTRSPRAPRRQFERGPSVSPSRERPSRSPSPKGRIHQLPRPGTDFTSLSSPTYVGDRDSPPPASYPQEPLSSPILHGYRRRQSSSSVVVVIENPSTVSLPLSRFANQQPLPDEPYTIGSPIDQPYPVGVFDIREGLLRHSPIASSPSATSNLELPDGRILQLINSEQVPRYTKEVMVQVDYVITSIKLLSLFSGPAKEHTIKFRL